MLPAAALLAWMSLILMDGVPLGEAVDDGLALGVTVELGLGLAA
jgi:hypothetical protein